MMTYLLLELNKEESMDLQSQMETSVKIILTNLLLELKYNKME